MAGSPPTVTAEQLEQARAAMGDPERLGLRPAADRVGVTVAALRRALAGGKLAPSPGTPAKPGRKPAKRPGSRKAPRVPQTPAGAPTPPSRATYAPPARLAPRPAPPPIPLAADPLDELRAYAEELRGRQKDQPAGSKEFRDLGAELRKVIGQMESIRLKRPVTETPEGRAAAQRPVAEAALGKIRSGVQAYAAREVETGACCRCGGALSPEVILRRRVEAGLDQPAPH